jgi:hypothetical protein
MREECKDCNRSLEDCTCIEDTIELPNQALIDAAERYQERSYSEEDMLKSFMAGIKCESNSGKNFEQFIKQFKNK